MNRSVNGIPQKHSFLATTGALVVSNSNQQVFVLHPTGMSDATAGPASSTSYDQLSQTRLMQQHHHHQPQQQQQQQLLSAASQPPAGASYLPPSSSSCLAPNRFGGNSSGGIHLPLGVSHLDPDGYLTSPNLSGLANPIQTGMGDPRHSGLGGSQQLGLGNPVQTGMGNPSQSAGLYQRPSSAQPLGGRQGMQVTNVPAGMNPAHTCQRCNPVNRLLVSTTCANVSSRCGCVYTIHVGQASHTNISRFCV